MLRRLLSSDQISNVPLSGPDASDDKIAAAVAKSDGMIVAIDEDWTLTKPQLDEILPEASKADWPSHFVLMSRNLEVQQGGPFAFAAKRAANKELWEANEKSVDNYRAGEAPMCSALAAGAAWIIIRAGTRRAARRATLATTDDGLRRPRAASRRSSPAVYKLGQQDTVNWRRIYDCGALGVELAAGDVLPAPASPPRSRRPTRSAPAIATAAPSPPRWLRHCGATQRRTATSASRRRRAGVPDAAAWAHVRECVSQNANLLIQMPTAAATGSRSSKKRAARVV